MIVFFLLIFLFLDESLLGGLLLDCGKVQEKDSVLRIKPCKMILNYKSEQHTFQEAVRCFSTNCVKLPQLQCNTQSVPSSLPVNLKVVRHYEFANTAVELFSIFTFIS